MGYRIGNNMDDIKFSKAELETIVAKLKQYFQSELDMDLGQFEAEFLLDFFAKEVGSFFYNRGLFDANQLLLQKTEELGYAIQELEKPTL